MDARPAGGAGTAGGSATVDDAARRLAETRARCAAAHARAEEAVQRAELALATSRDRLRRAQAVHDEILATWNHQDPSG